MNMDWEKVADELFKASQEAHTTARAHPTGDNVVVCGVAAVVLSNIASALQAGIRSGSTTI